MKTVHGADFYASKKHKGNDHERRGGGGGDDGNSVGELSPARSEDCEGAKASSISSPSAKSEASTVPTFFCVSFDFFEIINLKLT